MDLCFTRFSFTRLCCTRRYQLVCRHMSKWHQTCLSDTNQTSTRFKEVLEAHKHLCINTCTHTDMYTHSHTHVHIHTHTHMYTLKLTNTQVLIHTHIQTNTHTCSANATPLTSGSLTFSRMARIFGPGCTESTWTRRRWLGATEEYRSGSAASLFTPNKRARNDILSGCPVLSGRPPAPSSHSSQRWKQQKKGRMWPT